MGVKLQKEQPGPKVDTRAIQEASCRLTNVSVMDAVDRNPMVGSD